MRLVLVFVALLLSLPLSPQARPKGYELDYYRVRLESVETDGARGGVIGNPENEQGFTTPGYRDSTIRVVFTFEPTHVDFSLTNESDSDFGIIWDEAVFVDGVSNAAEGVFHRGVKLLDRHDAQVPSVVVKGSCVSESLAVKNRVFYSRDLKRWVFENLLRDADKLTQIKILLPIETAGGRRDYLFVFSVHWENRKVHLSSRPTVPRQYLASAKQPLNSSSSWSGRSTRCPSEMVNWRTRIRPCISPESSLRNRVDVSPSRMGRSR